MSVFRTMIASDEDHEKVFAEIFCDDKFVAIVNQEGGLRNLTIEFPNSNLDENAICRNVSMIGFMQALTEAKSRLCGEIV